MPYTKLGGEIKYLRIKRGFSQEQLAEKISMSTQHVAFIEQGRRIPQLKTLKKIAGVLGVRVKDLIPF